MGWEGGEGGAHAASEGAVEVSGVEQRAEHQTVQVDRLDVVGQQGALQPQYVPARHLVRAAHGEQPRPLQDSVPSLNWVGILHGDRPLNQSFRHCQYASAHSMNGLQE